MARKSFPMDSWQIAGIQDGDHLTVAQPAKRSTNDAFAMWCWADGMVTWGNLAYGDSSAVQHQLKRVQHIQATTEAFATILADGSVVFCGWVIQE